MTAYDDEPTSCPMCSVGLDVDALCDCDTDPKCIRCHAIYDVERGRWAEYNRNDEAVLERLRIALLPWGNGDVA